jgi:hypothetical protein
LAGPFFLRAISLVAAIGRVDAYTSDEARRIACGPSSLLAGKLNLICLHCFIGKVQLVGKFALSITVDSADQLRQSQYVSFPVC